MAKDKTPLSKLLALLTEEKNALLEGDLSNLPAFAQTKQRLIAAVETDVPDAADLTQLKVAAENNRNLLDAAMRGVKAARLRIDAARNGGVAFSTYDATGRAATHESRPQKIERRF